MPDLRLIHCSRFIPTLKAATVVAHCSTCGDPIRNDARDTTRVVSAADGLVYMCCRHGRRDG